GCKYEGPAWALVAVRVEPRRTARRRSSGGQRLARALDALARGLDRGFALLGRDRQAFGGDELHVGDPPEAEHVAQVRLDEVGRRITRMEPAVGPGDKDGLASCQSDRSGLRVLEGLAGHGDPVDPRLEL